MTIGALLMILLSYAVGAVCGYYTKGRESNGQ